MNRKEPSVKEQTHPTLRALALLLAILVAFGAGVLQALAAVVPVDPKDVIVNQSFNRPETNFDVEDVIWDAGWDRHEGISDYYIPNEIHVAVTAGAITFSGYGVKDYMDYAYSEGRYLNCGNTFTLKPQNMLFHTLAETGYLFNGSMKELSGDTYYTGYALVLSSASGIAAELQLYYIEDEKWQTENFMAQLSADASAKRTLLHTFAPDSALTPPVPAIPDRDTKQYRVDITINPLTCAFKIGIDLLDSEGELLTKLSGYETAEDALLGDFDAEAEPKGFGFYTGYYSHGCNVETIVKYEDVKVRVHELQLFESAKAEVRFQEDETNRTLTTAAVRNGYVGQSYKVVPPQTLEIMEDGKIVVYDLIRNSRGSAPLTAEINLSYQVADASNITTLFYATEKVIDPDPDPDPDPKPEPNTPKPVIVPIPLVVPIVAPIPLPIPIPISIPISLPGREPKNEDCKPCEQACPETENEEPAAAAELESEEIVESVVVFPDTGDSSRGVALAAALGFALSLSGAVILNQRRRKLGGA